MRQKRQAAGIITNCAKGETLSLGRHFCAVAAPISEAPLRQLAVE
jgi:hypothetical protein